MPRVISYARFSTRKQGKGHSMARQVEAAEEWCKEHGYTLEAADRYKDEGRSAFSGNNASEGDLSVIQKQLASGAIEPGSILIVEAWDRLSRQPLSKSISLMMALVHSGLTIVTLADRKVWTDKSLNDLGEFMMSVLTLYRGFQESQYKSDRLRKAFRGQRRDGSQQAFGSAPGWLKRDKKTEPWQVIPERAEIVQRVFEWSAAGLGSKLIAAKANAENWPVVTRFGKQEEGWHPQMPGQILRNRAVLGEMQHRIRTYEAQAQHWQGYAAGAPIKDYYPRIISDELWNRSRASIRSRAVAKRRDAHYYNVFSGLMYCGLCGAPIHRKSERTGHSHAQLQCSNKLAGKTDCKTMAANRADPAILLGIYEHALLQMGTDSGNTSTVDLAALEAAIAEKQEECHRIAEAVAKTKGKVSSFITKSIALADEVEALQQQLQELKEQQVVPTSSDGAFDYSFVTEAMSYLYTPDDELAKEKRVMLHLKLTRVVDTIWLFAYDAAVIKYRESPALHPVELQHKQLPSRVNPNAKYHKPPKPKPPPEKPYFAAAFRGQLLLPEARKTVSFNRKTKPLLLEYEEEAEELEMDIPEAA